MKNPHPRSYLSDAEYSKLLTDIMKMQAELWKNAPRVVYDRVNNNVNIRCGDTYVWSNENEK